jgi:hypothetical protein
VSSFRHRSHPNFLDKFATWTRYWTTECLSKFQHSLAGGNLHGSCPPASFEFFEIHHRSCGNLDCTLFSFYFCPQRNNLPIARRCLRVLPRPANAVDAVGILDIFLYFCTRDYHFRSSVLCCLEL